MKLPKINWPALVIIGVALWFLLSGRGPNLDGVVNQIDRWLRSHVVSAGASGGAVRSSASDPRRGWEHYYTPVIQSTPAIPQPSPMAATPSPPTTPTPVTTPVL